MHEPGGANREREQKYTVFAFKEEEGEGKKTEKKNLTTFKPFLTKQRSSWQHEMLPYFVYLSTQRKKQVGTSEGIKSWFFAD